MSGVSCGVSNIQYEGIHSVDFWNLDEETHICQNSWKNLYMIPTERPYIAGAQPSENLDRPPTINSRTYIPGFVQNTLTYNLKQGEWAFYIDHDKWDGSINCYKYLIEKLHGGKFAVRLNKTNGLVYTGRLQINGFEPDGSYSKVTIGYNLGQAVDAADLNLKVVVNWYDYDGTLIYSGLEDIGSTPTVPSIPSTDGTGGTDPTASWDDGSPSGGTTDPVSGNEDHHVASGTIIVDYGGYATDEKKGRVGNAYKFIPGWIEKPAMGINPIDSALPAAFWIMAFPKAYGENKDPTIEGVFVKGTTRIFVEYIEAISYDNALAPQPSNLTIGNVDNYSYDSETKTLYFY